MTRRRRRARPAAGARSCDVGNAWSSHRQGVPQLDQSVNVGGETISYPASCQASWVQGGLEELSEQAGREHVKGRWMADDPRLRRILRALAWSGGFLAFIGAVAVTPFVLNLVAPNTLDWNRLSDISQSYGAVSLVISAAALLGVVTSIAFQAKQARLEGEQTFRAAHRELTMLTLTDSALLRCWEPPRIPMTEARWKQLIVTNLIVSMWASDHHLGRLNDGALRVVLGAHFRGEVARAHWENSGSMWRDHMAALEEPRRLRFVEIVDEVYHHAGETGPPVMDREFFIPGD